MALLLRLTVVTAGTYRITPRRDHFQFGWEMGRLARSIATGQGFSSPTDLPSGPSAWAPPLYPYILAGVFRLFGDLQRTLRVGDSRLQQRLWGTDLSNSLSHWTKTLRRRRPRARRRGLGRCFLMRFTGPVRVVWETSLSTFLLSVALLWTLEMGDAPPERRKWFFYGLLWGVIILTNTALLAVLPLSLLWLLYRLPQPARQIRGMILCGVVAALVVSPWLVRITKCLASLFSCVTTFRLRCTWRTTTASPDCGHAMSIRGTIPWPCSGFRNSASLALWRRNSKSFRQFVREHPLDFAEFTVERAAYFWIGTPQATIVNGYDMIVARHVGFLIMALLAFGGLWLSFRNKKTGSFLLANYLLVYPLPYYLVNPFPRYKHPIEAEMILLTVYLLYEARRVQIRWPR